MIELCLCGPLSASITQKQCDINRETVGACRACPGLGAVVESVAGELTPVPKAPLGKTPRDYSQRGAAGFKRTFRNRSALTPQDRILGACVPVMEDVESPQTITFDVIEADDLEMLRRLERVVNESGTTLGDEIMLRLKFLEEYL
jgi:hypothetical protein